MNNIVQDIRFALRNLRKSPAFAVIAVLTLALGIGANTAIFTVVNAVFFHPLPVKDPARLMEIFTLDQRKIFGAANNNVLPNSFPNAQDIQQRAQSFSGVTVYESFATPVSMTVNGQPNQYFAQLSSGNYFDVLGVHAQLGRTFRPEEDRTDGAGPVVVLSHGFWERAFGGQSNGDRAERAAEWPGLHHYWRHAERFSGHGGDWRPGHVCSHVNA